MIELEKLKHSLLSNVSEDEISKRLNDISNTFNIDRKKIEKMYSDEKNISSYAYFYLPTNMYKMKFLFDFLTDDILRYLKSSTIIDIGTGPGTYIFSLIEWCRALMTVGNNSQMYSGSLHKSLKTLKISSKYIAR